LSRSRDKLTVIGCWQETLGKDQSLAELVAQGIKTVGGNDQEFIVAGGDHTSWGMADIIMPAIGKEQLKSALAFELRKQTPIPADKLLWGYRLLPATNDQQKQNIRLFYVREEQWRKWMNVLGGINHVDIILPAPLALDPLFADYNIIFPESQGNVGYRASKSAQQRFIVPNINLAAMTLPEAFPPAAEYQLDALEGISVSEQLSYIPALVLAAYGLSKESSKDQDTLIPPPEGLKAHRNLASKIIAFGLIFYILVTLISGLTRQLQAKAGHLRKIDSETQLVRALLNSLKKQNDPAEKEFVLTLHQELQDNVLQTPDFPEVLVELSNLIEPPTWASTRMEWNAGQITMQLQSTARNLELPENLEESPILGDVRELSSQFNQRVYTQRYNLNARFDTDDEKLEFSQRQKNRLEAARLRALAESAAQTNDNADIAAVADEESAEEPASTDAVDHPADNQPATPPTPPQ